MLTSENLIVHINNDHPGIDLKSKQLALASSVQDLYMKRMQIMWNNLKASKKEKHKQHLKKLLHWHVFWGEIACDNIYV